MEHVIEIKNIGKKYNITHQRGRYVALRDIIMGVLESPFSFLKRKAKKIMGLETKEEFWALKNVSFNVKKGEVVGIIGPNGAGKSTLLKILSQITPPTEGEIKISGRVGSLLEVGTGFHPELSGRENIFLNGAILGMTSREIAKKFDEIVTFAGIEKFLDTPVKHYSSGMYVRLAFSVAAHMEPDVLIVDEVLAVGDAEFQKKCLGKMDEITKKEGRTILFVSHNMGAIQSLCSRCVLLEKGQITKIGKTSEVINHYISRKTDKSEISLSPKNEEAGVTKIWLEDTEGNKVSSAEMGDDVILNVEYIIKKEIPIMDVDFLVSKNGVPLVQSFDIDANEKSRYNRKPGNYHAMVTLPTKVLKEGNYIVEIWMGTDKSISDPNANIMFEIVNTKIDVTNKSYHPERAGFIYTNLDWKTKKIEE